MAKEIVWAEDPAGNVIFLEVFDPKTQFDEMMKAYSGQKVRPKVKAFKMPMQDIVIRINTKL